MSQLELVTLEARRRELLAARQKAYYQSHREELAARKKAYRQSHREEEAARKKAYRQSHREEEAVLHKVLRLASCHCGEMFKNNKELKAHKWNSHAY